MSTIYAPRHSPANYRGRHRRPWGLRRKPVYVTLAALLTLAAIGGCNVATPDTDTAPTPAPTPATTKAVKAAPGSTAAKAAPPKAAAPAKIRDGQWQVGKDVAAGTYVTPGAKEGLVQFCTWSVKASDDSGADVVAFGSSGEVTEQGRVKLKAGQIFDTSGCQDWVKK